MRQQTSPDDARVTLRRLVAKMDPAQPVGSHLANDLEGLRDPALCTAGDT